MKVEPIFSKLGREVTLIDGSKIESGKALIQPLRYKNKMYLDGVYTEIGFNSQGRYLYIGPPVPDLTLASDTATVSSGDTSYRIDRAERVYNGNEVFYIWAIIRTIVEGE
ncbi:MAG: hypothetical protein IKK37_04570 [Clostridia bacterium]|nr:hypothetical protein [Clostridia bacterium]